MASDPKTEVIERLREHYDVRRVSGQSVFELNSKAEIYVRYSKDLGGRFFFGVGEKEFVARRDRNFFVLFVCGDADDVVVIPSATLAALLHGAPVAHGQWKLNIFVDDATLKLQVPTKGKFDVSQFRNHLDFSPPAVRRDYSPQLAGPPAQMPSAKPTEPTGESGESLADLLVDSARDSENPERFEAALLHVFRRLGLKGRLIGGPGDTDVLLEEPKRIVVDGKATKGTSVGHVNFTRIKQHQAAHDAVGMAVACVGFQPAVVRDAALEGAGLITVQALTEILRIHEMLPLSPFQYADLFLTRGLISREALLVLRREVDEQQQWIQDCLFILEHLDFQPRSLDEIKGRLDIRAQALGRGPLSSERIKQVLETLRQEPFKILESEEGRYCSRFYADQANSRLRAAIRLQQAP